MNNNFMKAVIFDRVGGPEVLKTASVPKPIPKYQEVVVRVKACALNRLDYYLRIEEDDAMPMPHILGSDIAGEIDTLGDGIAGWKVGDSVLVSPALPCGQCLKCRDGSDKLCQSLRILGYQTQGGYADYTVVPAQNLLPKPGSLSYEEAASIPLVFTTAYHQLFTCGGLKSGDTVLVMGASSGIGSAAVQLCKAAGARVITTVGTEEKIEQARGLGAQIVVNHSKQNWTDKVRQSTGGVGVDLVCEHFGGQFLTETIDLLSPGGRLITIGYTVGSKLHLDLAKVLSKQITIGTSYMGSKAELAEALKLIEWGLVKPVVDKIFPLEKAREAHEFLESRQHFGKIVLRVS